MGDATSMTRRELVAFWDRLSDHLDVCAPPDALAALDQDRARAVQLLVDVGVDLDDPTQAETVMATCRVLSTWFDTVALTRGPLLAGLTAQTVAKQFGVAAAARTRNG